MRHHRDRIHHRVDQAGDQVGRAGTGGRAAHADFAGGPRVAFGREAGVLLMPHQNVLDRVIVQGVVKRQRHAAGISENDLDLFPRQAFQHDLCAAHQFGDILILLRITDIAS